MPKTNKPLRLIIDQPKWLVENLVTATATKRSNVASLVIFGKIYEKFVNLYDFLMPYFFILTFLTCIEPKGRISPSWMARRNLLCTSNGIFTISSKNKVPLLTSSKSLVLPGVKRNT
jgi:hypothetical protein